MLTNLDWIGTGKAFPPEKEIGRLNAYKKYTNMFSGQYDAVYGAHYANRAMELRMRNVNVGTVVNYPQLLSKKTADFVCGEPPVIDIGDNTDVMGDTLETMNFSNVLYEAMIDVSRYGNAVLKVLADRVSITPPKHWYPIANPYDQKKIDYQVIAFLAGKQIYVEIHSAGEYEQRIYKAETGKGDGSPVKFGDLLEAKREITGIDDNAVQVLSNVTSSDSYYGVSDYDIISGVLRQLLWRIFCAERILDKHSAPAMYGPRSMLQKDPVTGVYILKPGGFFERNPSEPEPGYLTWDGNMQSVQWEIEWLTNQMYTLSEMGAAFLEGAGKGEANSGRALELRMTSPLTKARRLVGINDETVKRMIRSIAMAHGMPVEIKDISTAWQNGLPKDRLEECEIFEKATGGKPFLSQLSAIKQYNGYDDAAAGEELEEITAEQVSTGPALYNPLE